MYWQPHNGQMSVLAEQNHVTFQNKTYSNLILQSLAKTKEKLIYQREIKHMLLTSTLASVTLMYANMNSTVNMESPVQHGLLFVCPRWGTWHSVVSLNLIPGGWSSTTDQECHAYHKQTCSDKDTGYYLYDCSIFNDVSVDFLVFRLILLLLQVGRMLQQSHTETVDL